MAMHYITPGLFTKPIYKAYVIQKIKKIKEKN